MGFLDFLRPKWRYSDDKVRKGYIKDCLEDPKTLFAVIQNDPVRDVRIEAVKKLGDQVMLAAVVKSNDDWEVQLAAAKKLDDQAILKKLATDELSKDKPDGTIFTAAINRINDQEFLVETARREKLGDLLEKVIERFDDPAILWEYAQQQPRRRETYIAIKRLSDVVASGVNIKDPKVIDFFLGLLHNEFLSSHAAKALAYCHDARVLGALLDLLPKRDLSIIRALGQHRDRLAIPPLLELLKQVQEHSNMFSNYLSQESSDRFLHSMEVEVGTSCSLAMLGEESGFTHLMDLLHIDRRAKIKGGRLRSNYNAWQLEIGVERVAKALGRLNDKRAAKSVIAYLLSVRCEGFLLVGSPSYVEEDYQKIIREFTLFGCYRDLLFTAIRPRQFGLKGDFCSYEIGELIEATRQICQIKTRIATNLLHQISAREDVEVLKRDGCEDGANEYSRLSLERQREIAREELRNRGNPIFEEAAYLDPQAWDKDWETVHLSSFKINT